MIIVLKPNLSKKQEATVLKEIRKRGYRPHVMRGVARTVIGAIGDELTHQSLETLATLFPQIVESVLPIQKRYKLVSREAHPANSTINPSRAASTSIFPFCAFSSPRAYSVISATLSSS